MSKLVTCNTKTNNEIFNEILTEVIEKFKIFGRDTPKAEEQIAFNFMSNKLKQKFNY